MLNGVLFMVVAVVRWMVTYKRRKTATLSYLDSVKRAILSSASATGRRRLVVVLTIPCNKDAEEEKQESELVL